MTLSMIETFQICPLKYDLMFIKKEKTGIIDSMDLAAQCYIAVSRIIMKSFLSGTHPDTLQIRNLVVQKWAERSRGLTIDSLSDFSEEQLLDLLPEALDRFGKMLGSGVPGRLIHPPVTVDIDLSENGNFILRHGIHGIFQQDGTYMVLRQRFGPAYPEIHADDSWLRMDCLAAGKIVSRNVNYPVVYFPWFQKHVSCRIHSEFIEETTGELAAKIQLIQQQDHFPARPGVHCRSCFFRRECVETHISRGKTLYEQIHDPALRMAYHLLEIRKQIASLQRDEQHVLNMLQEHAKKTGQSRIYNLSGELILNLDPDGTDPGTAEDASGA